MRSGLLAVAAGLWLAAMPVLGAPAAHYVGTLAGSSSLVTSRDGALATAVFRGARHVAVDSQGAVYVADSGNHTIRKISNGQVSTLAGTAGTKGFADGAAASALFNEPNGVLVASDGSVLVLDTNNGRIRKISNGQVTTVAGGASSRKGDGTGTAAGFDEPRGFAQDSAGNLYVADYNNQTIRKVTPAGVVTTLAGSTGQQGSTDGSGTAARFSDPQAVAVDSAGNLYVTDTGPTKGIRMVTPAGLVTTLVSSSTSNRLAEPRGIVVRSDGSLLVSDTAGHEVMRVSSSGSISSFIGTQGTAGVADGTGTAAGLNGPIGLTMLSDGSVLVADTGNNLIRSVSTSGVVTTHAGVVGYSASVVGDRSLTRFEDPYAVALDSAGNAYVADATDHAIRVVSTDGASRLLAGIPGSFGYADGQGTAARFRSPKGIAVASDGVVFVADTGNQRIRRIAVDGTVTTIAGSGQKGARDGTGVIAEFNEPYGVAVDSAGVLYVADFGGNAIRRITSSGVVTTFAGGGGSGFVNGTGTAARFSGPMHIAVDSAGNLYVIDRSNHSVRKITSAGVVTTLAGSGSKGSSNGTGTAASFHFPSGLAVDSAGNVLVADTDNQVIRHITSAGEVTNLAGGTLGFVNGVGSAARFNEPKDVAIQSSGRIVVADRGNHSLRSMQPLASGTTAVDCLLDWGEANYASLLNPPAMTQIWSPYTFRSYANSTYVGVSSADQQVYLLSGGRLSALGLSSGFLSTAQCVAP